MSIIPAGTGWCKLYCLFLKYIQSISDKSEIFIAICTSFSVDIGAVCVYILCITRELAAASWQVWRFFVLELRLEQHVTGYGGVGRDLTSVARE